ncbi:MAG: TRAP transporter substrate-binding protein [Deltaproteobacteria bacterium CG_4_8_14_3_um_filter_45_9]|nr:MAG: TRAP transporter substrate-binding protein [Deltaproteobacteria bacterium CG03_land_8_20_14_0_80_45_14]PIX23406.1 MAG: TRAP transporter substrate-binding protein [Deltaproteobacteria bacterium CG_4_8_14_3_um_filter_45_9]
MKKALSFLIVAGLLCGVAVDSDSQVRDIAWGTSAVGSAGHRAQVNLAAVLNREMPGYRIMVLPTPGAIVTVKGYATGQFDGYYGADIAFYELANDINRFKGFKPQIKRYPVQSFWAYTMEVGVGIHAKDRDKYKQWRDLSGQRVFTGPLPWDVRAQLERGFQELGVKHQYVEVDLATVGSLLEGGGIKAFIAYTAAETTPPPFITELSLATEWAILNPSKEEIDLLKKAGFLPVEVKPGVFKKDVHVDKVIFLPFFYGFHVGLEVPEKDVYKMLTIIEKNAGELFKADAGFEQVRKDMRGLQRRGVESAVNFVPIHPGLAKYMKERGVWNPKWDDRIAKGK